MKKPLRAVLIDPHDKTIKDVETSGDLQDIYRLIGCQSIDAVYLTNRDALLVDDDGLRTMPTGPFFAVRGYPQPLAGRGLILGFDREGENRSTTFTAALAAPNIAWPDVVFAGSQPIPPGTTVDHPVTGPNTPVFGETPIFRPRRTN